MGASERVQASWTKTTGEPGLVRVIEAAPLWTGMATIGDIVHDRTILHAGPSYVAPTQIPRPVRYSAALAAIFEGWADDLASALASIATAEIKLAAAQDHGVLVPLAGVASPSMAAHVIEDGRGYGTRTYVVVNEGNDHALRFGRFDHGVVSHHKWLSGELAEWLTSALRQGPVELLPMIDEALILGDDCHSLTAAGSELLWRRLLKSSRPNSERIERFIHEATAFSMNVWMGACRCSLSAAADARDGDMVITGGGNGVDFAIQRSSAPGHWIKKPAPPPAGDETRHVILGAIGDSAVIDLFGLGAMGVRSGTKGPLPGLIGPEWPAIADGLLAVEHPQLARSRRKCVIRADVVRDLGTSVRIALGQIDAAGVAGRVGGGILTPPKALFAEHLTSKDEV